MDKQLLRYTEVGVSSWPRGSEATGRWAQGYRVGDIVFLQGQTGLTLDGEVVGVGDPAAQTRQALENITELLRIAGGTLADVVKIVVYVTDRAHRAHVYPVISQMFGELKPASTGLIVAGLAIPELLVEIDAYAAIG